MKYRVHGRATQTEERILRNIDRGIAAEKQLVGHERFRELTAMLEQNGKSAFDRPLTTEYDQLVEIHGGTVMDAGALASSDKERRSPESHPSLWDKANDEPRYWPDAPYPPEHVLPVNDGVNLLWTPADNRAERGQYDANYPEDEFPDNVRGGKGLLGDVWHAPRKGAKTRHATLMVELGVLLHYRKLQTGSAPLQSNFYSGDNENFIQSDDDDTKPAAVNLKGEWEIRPSVNEILRPLAGVPFEKRMLNQTDTIVGPDFRRVSIGESVTRGKETGATERMGHLLFRSMDYKPNNQDGGRRGQLTHYFSGGVKHKVKDQAGTPHGPSPSTVSVLNSLFDDTVGAKASNSNVREWTAEERAARDKITDGIFPPLPPVSMPLAQARTFCGLPPAVTATARIPYGLPFRTVSASHLSMSADGIRPNIKTGAASNIQTSHAMHGSDPEGILLTAEMRARMEAALGGMTEEERTVLDTAAFAENFEQVGKQTGGQDNHPRTNERNGKLKTLVVAGKLSSIVFAKAA